mmetsp:Transcript_12603/g.25616  ORF Transcript_12603/g.25616 Transcript_12603/m.25616 type:complete len:270 (-) Transcript_12603:660-1469(-)
MPRARRGSAKAPKACPSTAALAALSNPVPTLCRSTIREQLPVCDIAITVPEDVLVEVVVGVVPSGPREARLVDVRVRPSLSHSQPRDLLGKVHHGPDSMDYTSGVGPLQRDGFALRQVDVIVRLVGLYEVVTEGVDVGARRARYPQLAVGKAIAQALIVDVEVPSDRRAVVDVEVGVSSHLRGVPVLVETSKAIVVKVVQGHVRDGDTTRPPREEPLVRWDVPRRAAHEDDDIVPVRPVGIDHGLQQYVQRLPILHVRVHDQLHRGVHI